jgi:hypothetical protein
VNTRYPRTLQQAFPRTAAYGAAIERPTVSFWRRLWLAVWRWL